MHKILIIGTGGFIGAVGRYYLSGWIQRAIDRPWYPFGTLGVNCLGCLVIGLLAGLADNRNLFSPDTRLFLLVGLLGAFTTFSTFGFETFALIRDEQFILAGINIAGQIILGLIAVWLGYTLSNLI